MKKKKSNWNDLKRNSSRNSRGMNLWGIILTILLLAATIIFIASSYRKSRQEQQTLSQKNQEHWEERVKIKNAQRERLKNYTVYDKLQKEETVRAFVMGDEIAAQRGKEFSNTGWWDLLESNWKREYKVKVEKVDNTAFGTNVFQWLYAYQQMDEDAREYDIAFISLGYNDQQEMTAKQFGQCYEALIRQMKEDNPKCEIVLIIANCISDASFREKIKALSDYYDLVCLDMVKGFKKSALSESELTNDGFYPNNDGYREYYDNIHKLLRDNMEKEKEIKDTLPSQRLNKGSGQFEELELLPLAEMEKESDTTYSYETDAELVGVSYMTESDYGGTFTTYLNGKKVQDYKTDSFESSDQAGIIGNSLKGTNSVKLKVAEKDTGFVTIYGLIVSK